MLRIEEEKEHACIKNRAPRSVLKSGKGPFLRDYFDDEHFPHEVYRSRRLDNGKMWVFSYWYFLIYSVLILTLGQSLPFRMVPGTGTLSTNFA